MNENLDLTKILYGCPEGTEFYNTVYGKVKFLLVDMNRKLPIVVSTYDNLIFNLPKDGKLISTRDGECTLFPSKDQRDWSKFKRFWDKIEIKKFDPKTLQPFDKVLGFYEVEGGSWECTIFSHLIGKECSAVCAGMIYNKYIPYNEETKHLVGTKDDCPEYYKWWEK